MYSYRKINWNCGRNSGYFVDCDHSPMNIGDFISAGYNFLPSVLFFTGLAALTLGWAPKLGKVIYVYLGYSFGLNYFGGIIDLPEWFSKTAVQSWIPRMPIDQFEVGTFITITVIAIAMVVFGYIGYSKRDMVMALNSLLMMVGDVVEF